jgi:hypothetical protein
MGPGVVVIIEEGRGDEWQGEPEQAHHVGEVADRKDGILFSSHLHPCALVPTLALLRVLARIISPFFGRPLILGQVNTGIRGFPDGLAVPAHPARNVFFSLLRLVDHVPSLCSHACDGLPPRDTVTLPLEGF